MDARGYARIRSALLGVGAPVALVVDAEGHSRDAIKSFRGGGLTFFVEGDTPAFFKSSTKRTR
jgi:hypothetical protein